MKRKRKLTIISFILVAAIVIGASLFINTNSSKANASSCNFDKSGFNNFWNWFFNNFNNSNNQTKDNDTDYNSQTSDNDIDSNSQTSDNEDSITSGKNYMDKMEKVNDCPQSAYQQKSGVNYGSFKKESYSSTTTNTTRNVNILLPANYDKNKKYPVCYVLHGIMGNEDSMINSSYGLATISNNLLSEKKAKEMIIVCPNIFAPKDPNTRQDFSDACFEGYDNFKNDLLNDLMPWLEKNYSVATGRENTAVCGFSMGGRTALYIGYTCPDKFAYIGAFSPAPGIFATRDNFASHKGLMTEDEFRVDDEKNAPYVSLITCGTNDSVVGQYPKTYHDVLTKNNQEHVWIEVPNADHDDRAIRCGFYNFASSIFGILD